MQHLLLVQLWAAAPFVLLSIQQQRGEPSPALRQLGGMLAGVLCDVGSALKAYAELQLCSVLDAVRSYLSLSARLASHGTDAARAWRAQLLSLEPIRLLGAVLEGSSRTRRSM